LGDELIERGATDDILRGALMAQYDAFTGFNGRSCQVCDGGGCHRCEGRGYFAEPEPEQVTLF
jgi:hypothetical protein